MCNISALIDHILYHLTRYSLIQTTACESICKSNLFIHIHPDVSALGASPIAKLQIHLFIKPWQVVSFQLEYLGQNPLVVSLSKSVQEKFGKLVVGLAKLQY